MTKAEKTIEKMRANPRNDWTMSDLETAAARYGVAVRKGSGSHVTFSHSLWREILTVPAARPIKPIYIRRFVSLIDTLNQEEV